MTSSGTDARWKVAKDLQDSQGVAWVRARYSGFDFSELERLTLKRGAWGGPNTKNEQRGRRTNPVKGLCEYPVHTDSGMYRVKCSVNARPGWPAPVYQRVSPLYMNEDGSWDEVPANHIAGTHVVDEKTGKEWLRLKRLVPLASEDEAIVYIVAHELFHFFRKTRQIEGKNTEIEADSYAEAELAAFRGTSDG